MCKSTISTRAKRYGFMAAISMFSLVALLTTAPANADDNWGWGQVSGIGLRYTIHQNGNVCELEMVSTNGLPYALYHFKTISTYESGASSVQDYRWYLGGTGARESLGYCTGLTGLQLQIEN